MTVDKPSLTLLALGALCEPMQSATIAVETRIGVDFGNTVDPAPPAGGSVLNMTNNTENGVGFSMGVCIGLLQSQQAL